MLSLVDERRNSAADLGGTIYIPMRFQVNGAHSSPSSAFKGIHRITDNRALRPVLSHH